MVSSLLARCIIVTIGTLYPGYRSYKSLINSDLREVVNCLRYWIVFSIFIACETVTDILLSWFPFYYWIKIIIVLGIVNPAGSTFLYKRFVQPALKEREQDIDQLIEQTKQKGYSTLLDFTNKGIRYASNVVLNSALMGQTYLGEHMKRSLSTSDISNGPTQGYVNRTETVYEEDEETDAKLEKRLKEDQNYLSKGSKVPARRPRSQQKGKVDEPSDDPLDDLEMSKVMARKQTRSANKTSSTAYSSNDSTHIGTISKRQMMKTTTSTSKKPVVQPTAPVEYQTNSSDGTDDENEKVSKRT